MADPVSGVIFSENQGNSRKKTKSTKARNVKDIETFDFCSSLGNKG